VRIATNCFTKEEVELLSLVLDSKFNLKSSLHKNNSNYSLLISEDSRDLLISIVRPYLLPSYLQNLYPDTKPLTSSNIMNSTRKNLIRKVGVSRYHTISGSPVKIEP